MIKLLVCYCVVCLLQNPATITRIMLSHFNWDKEKLMERQVFSSSTFFVCVCLENFSKWRQDSSVKGEGGKEITGSDRKWRKKALTARQPADS